MLSVFNLACIAVAAGLLILLLRHISSCLSAPSAAGPALARWSSLWYLCATWRGDFEQWNIRAHASGDKKIVRVAPRMYSIDDPAAMKKLYAISSPMPKSSWYEAFGDPRVPNHNLFSTRDRTFHAGMRRKLGSLYAMSAIKSYEPYVDEGISLLVEQFDQCVQSGRAVDLQHWMQCYAFDVIGKITFGDWVGFLQSGGRDIDGIIQSLENSNSFATLMGIQPVLAPLLFALYGHPVKGLNDFSARLKREAAAADERDEKRRGQTFHEKLEAARTQDPEDYQKFHMDVAHSTNVAAGSDTTSISLTSALFYILTTPDVLTKLRCEIQNTRQSAISDEHITFDQAMKMPYLHCCIKETLRLHPATGLPMWREVVAEPVEVSGVTFPPGSILGVNSWVAHRNTSIYGADAHIFRPERWDPDVTPHKQLDAMEKYYLPFGAGTRTCIGRHISHLEMVKALPVLLERYDFALGQDQLRSRNMWFVKPTELLCRLRRRERED